MNEKEPRQLILDKTKEFYEVKFAHDHYSKVE